LANEGGAVLGHPFGDAAPDQQAGFALSAHSHRRRKLAESSDVLREVRRKGNRVNASPFRGLAVKATPEISRIAALPRRSWSDEAAARLAEMMTNELKTPRGTMSLRRVQAIALYEAMESGGLFGPIRVGGGKTLLTLLVPLVLDAKRPVLLLPAALVEKTWHELAGLREHWRLPTNVQIVSYEMLGLVQSAQKLEYIRPDLIVADEVHMLKNLRAGRTRRVVRYMREHPETCFVGVSGTVMKKSIRDFAHILRWCLKDGAPIPETEDETAAWADALDEKVNPLGRRQPGALFDLDPVARDTSLTASMGSLVELDAMRTDSITRARRVFQGRLLDTRGVVASPKNDGVTCSLRISALPYEPSPSIAEHFTHVRTTMSTPDGWSFAEPTLLRMYLRQLALGFHSVWDPRPPAEWIEARRNWAAFVREVLAESHQLDTELQVTNAVDAGRLSTSTLSAWRAVQDSFKIQPKDIWHDDSALQACVTWMERERGIVWTEHRFFARRLAGMAGATYYGENGMSDKGESITLVKPGKAIVASRQANATGRNLQMFSTNLITSCEPSALIVEQLIGRTHRDGQEADEVAVDILLGCREHHDSFQQALDGARATADTLGHDQKLLISDITIPDISQRTGPLWQ
jgi:hypothetical protein